MDALLVLGQVPGTSFYITFNELLFIICAFILSWIEIRNHQQITKKAAWFKKRTGINYRRQKRHLKSVIKKRRQRLIAQVRRSYRKLTRRLNNRVRRSWIYQVYTSRSRAHQS